MKNQTGIWLDYREALIIRLAGKKDAKVERLLANINTSHFKGGSRSKTPWGPMEKVSESKFLHRRKQEEALFFERIMEAVKDADELFIFGPAEARDGLVKAIKNARFFAPHLMAVEAADSMTLNQKIARVRTFYTEGITV